MSQHLTHEKEPFLRSLPLGRHPLSSPPLLWSQYTTHVPPIQWYFRFFVKLELFPHKQHRALPLIKSNLPQLLIITNSVDFRQQDSAGRQMGQTAAHPEVKIVLMLYSNFRCVMSLWCLYSNVFPKRCVKDNPRTTASAFSALVQWRTVPSDRTALCPHFELHCAPSAVADLRATAALAPALQLLPPCVSSSSVSRLLSWCWGVEGVTPWQSSS